MNQQLSNLNKLLKTSIYLEAYRNMKIILKSETSLGLESYEELGFNSEEELELEISKLTKFRPEFDTNLE